MKNKIKKDSFSFLRKELSGINKRGKPSGQRIVMLNEEGLATGSIGKDRSQVSNQILEVLENLIKHKHHFVLQANEGDGIKIIGVDGLSRCIMLYRSNNIQTFNLRADREIAQKLLNKVSITKDNVNIRNNSKSRYVYTDFDSIANAQHISEFIMSLPPSATCSCGHPNDISKNSKISEAA